MQYLSEYNRIPQKWRGLRFDLTVDVMDVLVGGVLLALILWGMTTVNSHLDNVLAGMEQEQKIILDKSQNL